MMKKQMQLLVLAGLCLVLLGLPAPIHAQQGGACEQTVTVRAGDTLSRLAGTYLGSFAAYPAIVEATNAAAAADSSFATIENPGVLQIGWKLCVPAPSTNAAGPPIAAPVTPTPEPDTGDSDLFVEALDDPAQHPLAVAYLRDRTYPGSEIIIEQTLAPGGNYNQYVVSYRSDGNKIYALMTVPQGHRPATGWPVIFFNHGHIPPTIYRTTERYVAYVDAFARNGYIVFKSDYRGHGFSEGEPASGHGSADYTIDVLNAVSSIRQYPDADPERIGMWGHSMGGGITLRSMVVTDTIKAGVIWGGVVVSFEDSFTRPDLQTVRVPNWFEEPRAEYVDAYGTVAENPAFWRAISPNAFLADLSGPIQLHHAIADDSVPVEYSDVLAEQIQDADGTVEAYRYAGDNHNISVNFGTAMARSVAFFDRYVKNVSVE